MTPAKGLKNVKYPQRLLGYGCYCKKTFYIQQITPAIKES